MMWSYVTLFCCKLSGLFPLQMMQSFEFQEIRLKYALQRMIEKVKKNFGILFSLFITLRSETRQTTYLYRGL